VRRTRLLAAGIAAIGDIRRDDIEDYKVWLAGQPRSAGKTITAETHRQRMRTARQFFERIIERDWPDAPPRRAAPPRSFSTRPAVPVYCLSARRPTSGPFEESRLVGHQHPGGSPSARTTYRASAPPTRPASHR